MADNGFIKPDPDVQAAPPLDDEDLFEDAGDLEFYDKNLASTYETLYLARIPRYMWEAWQKLSERLDDDEEVQIGTLRTWNEPGETDDDGNVGPETTKLRMLLDPGCDEHHALPREYDLDVLDRDVRNHFIFTEEDLPSYKAKNKERQDQINAGIPAHILRQKEAAATAAATAAAGGGVGPQRNTYDRKSRFQPYYRKAIPKKTKIFGKIHYDVRVEPRNTGEEERYLGQQLFQAENSKAKLQIISRNTASSIINPGTAGAVGWAGNFIKNTPSLAKPKKGEHFKAARIPKNQLLDLIFDCFRQYQYWSMKALRQRTQQPDSYLRQVLEEVAVLNKSGPFANHYCLSEAYRDKAGNESREAAAAETVDDGDDDEPEEMEDVVLS
ncbi:transcription initiation factor iif [Beauveria brongniartii RCEF 3172]|uniref:Transcription initiation factor IIF subunit beta n=1 Tax=Beauveria brongniartii RCEF 3172 TaxID=1081107 RepID=A0A167DVE8_9HYPO|nr:transcription initiation factor iif [Beauveria brongniartii RCEF 3172]